MCCRFSSPEWRDLRRGKSATPCSSRGLSQVLIAPLIARLSQRMDLRIMLVTGFITFAFGLWLSAGVTSQWQGGEFFWPQIVRGFAILMCIVPATTMALGALPPAQLKNASALFNTMRNLGGASASRPSTRGSTTAPTCTGRVWVENLHAGDPRVQTWLQNATAQIGTAGADPGVTSQRAISLLAQTVRQEAVTLAFADVFWLIARAVPRLPCLRAAAQAAASTSGPKCRRALSGCQRTTHIQRAARARCRKRPSP